MQQTMIELHEAFEDRFKPKGLRTTLSNRGIAYYIMGNRDKPDSVTYIQESDWEGAKAALESQPTYYKAIADELALKNQALIDELTKLGMSPEQIERISNGI